jgi:XTP/dITP diphosphohydrolase
MQSIVIASHNKGKIIELQALLKNFNLRSIAEYGLAAPEETGSTFAENAEIKALEAMRASGLTSMADDSGLAIDALNGKPGVYSADWAVNGDFNIAFQRIADELREIKIDANGARAKFLCNICLALPDKQPLHFVGEIKGILCYPPRGENGFGYDSIFIPDGLTKTFAEISKDEKNTISHRAKALRKFIDFMDKR